MFALVATLAACDDGGGGGAGGDGGNNNVTGTCSSTCTKSIALGCTGGEHDQARCVASCNSQQTSCMSAGKSTEFQTYLDCIESTPMTCGSSSGTPTSAMCVGQGFAVFQCSLAAVDGGT